MKAKHLLVMVLVILCLAVVTTQKKSKRPFPYDHRHPLPDGVMAYGVFAFSWMEGHCGSVLQRRKGSCHDKTLDNWDGQSFTIHGLWVIEISDEICNWTQRFIKQLRDFDEDTLAAIQADHDHHRQMRESLPPASRIKNRDKFAHEFLWNTSGTSTGKTMQW